MIPTGELEEERPFLKAISVANEVALLDILDPLAHSTYTVGELISMRVLVANLGTETIGDLSVEVDLWRSTVLENTELDDSWEIVDTWAEVLICATCYETQLPSASMLGPAGHEVSTVQLNAEEGHYRFIVRLIMADDTDSSNNEAEVDFGVYPPLDIGLYAFWDDSGTDTLDMTDSSAQTTCPDEERMCYDFTVRLAFDVPGWTPPENEEDRSDFEFSIRDIVMEIRISNTGVHDAMLIDRGGRPTSFYDAGEPSSTMIIDQIGELEFVIVGFDMIPDEDQQPGGPEYAGNASDRYIPTVEEIYEYNGRVEVDETDHAFRIDAVVVSYKLWQNTTTSYDCVLRNQAVGLPDWLPCEEELFEDRDTDSDIFSLLAHGSTFDDINFVGITFRSRLANTPTPDSISMGDNNVYFEVAFAGNDQENDTYEYAIDVDITAPGGIVVSLQDVNSLTPEISREGYRCREQREDHNKLGGPTSPPVDTLCLTFNFLERGWYTISATVRMVNTGEYLDEVVLNDEQIYRVEVVNHAPYVVLDMEASEPLVLQDNFLMKLTGLDFDAVGDESDNFVYGLNLVRQDMLGDVIGCIDEFQDGASKYCEGKFETAWLSATHVRGTITDIYGASSYVDIPITVWARGIFEDTSGDFYYDVAYRSTEQLNYDVTEDVNSDGTVDSDDEQKNIELPGLQGEYDSEGAWRITKVTDDPDVIGVQSLKITLRREADAEANGSLWRYDELESAWILLPTRVYSNDGFKKLQTIIWEPGDGESLLPSGLYAVFIAKAGYPPNTGLASLGLTNLPRGIVDVEWVLDGTLQSGDSVEIYYSSGTTAFDGDDAGSHSITNRFVTSWLFNAGEHGETFQFTVRTENVYGANEDGALDGAVTIDALVSPEPEVTNVQLFEQDVKVLVTWDSNRTIDVHHWEVCRGVDPGSLTSCFETDGTATQLLTAKPSISVKWFYSIIAVDEHGNEVQLGQASLDLSTTGPISGGEDGADLGVKVEGALPVWTYPAIGGVVLLSVVAGVILVVRGGGGDSDQEWDY